MYKILLLFLCFNSFAQSEIVFNASADNKLLFTDDDYGNKAGTLDLNLIVSLDAEQRKIGFWSMIVSYENAQLKGGAYTRYGLATGYNFNKIINKVNIKPYISYGNIIRYKAVTASWESGVIFYYKIYKRISYTLGVNWTKRTDLKNNPFRFGTQSGISIGLNTDYKKK